MGAEAPLACRDLQYAAGDVLQNGVRAALPDTAMKNGRNTPKNAFRSLNSDWAQSASITRRELKVKYRGSLAQQRRASVLQTEG